MMENSETEAFAEDIYKSLTQNGDLMSCLSKFIKLSENFNCKTSEYDIVKNYLRLSGDCREILQLIKGICDSDSQKAMLIMETLCHILIYVASNLQAYMSVGTSIVNEILAHGMRSIFNFLKIKQKSSRTKLALHLLSCMVALGGQTVRQVVSKLDFSNVTFTHLLNRKNFSEEEDVRTTFINFIIILLTNCDKNLIRQLVEVKGFLNDILPGLVSDRAHIITLVLSTFKNLIVENMIISKTTKLHLFNDHSLKSVVRLYSWKGPIRDKIHRKRKLGEEDVSIAYEATEEEISNVQMAAHEFMLSLCCSFKTGIIFQDFSYGSSGKNHNIVLTSILNYMPKPHLNKLASELVISVLKTCPDQMVFYLPSLKDSFTPRLSSLWVDVTNIIKKIILAQDPVSCLFKHGEKKPVSVLINIAKSLSFPSLITSSEISDVFKDKEPFICYHLCDFFICTLQKVKSISEYCLQADFSKTPYSSVDVSTFSTSFLTDVIQNFVFVKDLEGYWEKITTSSAVCDEKINTDLPIPSLSSQLCKILELMQHFLHVSRLVCYDYDVNVPKLFQSLKNCHNLLSHKEIYNLNMKLVDIISAQGEEVIKLWNQNVIDSPLMVLLDVYMTSDMANAIDDVSEILCKVLMHTKVFEFCPWEINIWLESIKTSKTKHVPSIIEFINSSVCTLLQNPNMFSDAIIENTFDKTNSQMSLNVSSILNDLLSKDRDPVLVEVCEDSSDILSAPKLCFSSLVPAALSALNSVDNKKKKVCKTFLEKALCHIMYHQQSPKVLFSVIQKYKENISQDLFNYFELLCPDKYVKKTSVEEEDKSMLCKTDISDHLKARFLSLHVLPNNDSGCFCDIQCDLHQLDLNYKEKIMWQIMTYLDWEITLLMENRIENSNVEKYLNLLENLLISLNLKICESDPDDGKAIYKISEDFFSRPIMLKLFLWAEKVPKSKKPLLRKFVNRATELVLKFSSTIILHEQYNKHLTGYKDKIVKYNSIHFQTRNWPKGAVMYENPDICDIISKFAVLISSRDVTVMLEDALNTESEGVKLENYFPVVTFLFKMYVESEDFVPLAPKAINSLFIKCASLSKKQIEIISEYTMKMFKQHPDLTSVINADSCHLLLKQPGNKSFYLLGSLVDYNKDLRKIIQSAIVDNLEYFKSTSDFLYLIPKCIQQSTSDDVQDKRFLEAVSLLYWEAVSSYILIDITSPDTLLENSGTGKALQVLFKQKILAMKKLSKFFKKNNDALCAALPDSSKVLVFFDLMEIMKSYILERNKSPVSLIKLTIQWLTNAVSSIKSASEFNYFPLLKFTVSLFQDIPEIALEDLVKIDTFFQQILKVALKHTDIGIYLIEILTILCKKCLNLPTQLIFDLVTGHSNFFNVMLSQDKENESLKECIIDILITLVSTDKSLCKDNHLGLILSSYTGTLKSVDQKLLYLIKLYSESNVDMDQFSPFLWSEAAIVQYSVIGAERRYLAQKPKLQDLLSLFIPERIETTVVKYPLTLKLEPLIPDPNELVDCSELDKIYDLRFFLPLFANILSPGSFVHFKSFMHSKVLMLIFSSLSSFDKNTRSLGYYCLSQLYFQLEGASYAEKPIWLCLLDSLRNSINSENPRIPSIVSIFLARVSLIFTKPEHPLYSVLYKFITVKPNLDIGQVPEFYTLFNSIENEHRAQRMWLLQLITDGLRTSSDFHICEKRYIFSILLTHYWSSISTEFEKVAILNAISAAVKIETSARVLCQNSLLPWLHHIIEELDLLNSAIVRSLCVLVKNLWLSTKKICSTIISKDDTSSISENSDTKTKTLYTSFPNEFQLVVLSLCKKLEINISSDDHQDVLHITQCSTNEIDNIDGYIIELNKHM